MIRLFTADLYGTNPKHTAAAKAELDRRNTRLKIIGLVLSFISAAYILWQAFNYFFQKPLPLKSNPNIFNQQNNADNKPNKNQNIYNDHNKIPVNNRLDPMRDKPTQGQP